MIELSPIEARVLGSLLEKEMATPEYYPLTLNALTAACNQKSSREPVMALDESKVLFAVARLRENGLIEEKSEAGNRAARYVHKIEKLVPASSAERAVLCVLLLRGPQTPGEIRGRAARLHDFPDPAKVEAVLNDLMTRFAHPMVEKLPRQSGRKENRYAHLLAGPPTGRVDGGSGDEADTASRRIDALERRVAALEALVRRPPPETSDETSVGD